MPPRAQPLFLACLAYFTVALPGSTLGLIWPSMRLSLHEPIGALGILLIFGVAASVVSSAAVGRVLSRVSTGSVLALGTMLVASALAAEALASSFATVAAGSAVFGLGFGAVDSALNVYAVDHFGARQITWMHAGYGLGAMIGPLLVTALLGDGLGWRRAYGAIAVVLALLGLVFTAVRRRWESSEGRETPPSSSGQGRDVGEGGDASELSGRARQRRRHAAIVLGLLAFVAVETGIESVAGTWGYVFLTAGRGLSDVVAGIAVSAYWAMMFLGRVVLGPVAQRVGAHRVLPAAVAGVAVGAAVMTVPTGVTAVVGLMALGLAAAPVFPLTALTALGGVSAGRTTRTVALQVAASSVGGAVLPAGAGTLIGATSATVLAPSLLVLGLAMCGVYWLLSRPAGSAR